MSACDNCLLYQAELRHCKIGKAVHEMFCSAQFAPQPNRFGGTADQPLQIGKPWPHRRGV